MLAYVFPGQGSQFRGMGSDLFAEFPELIAAADAVLGYSIKTLCLDDPNQQLNQTQFTQPALYTINALSYLKKLQATGKKPDYVAGHSLGEYNALLAADVFDFVTGLKLVQKRGELMSQASGGGMAAIIGLSPDEIHAILQKNNFVDVGIANYNAPKQSVISGLKEEIERAKSFFQHAAFIPLKVSGAFHSQLMSSAQAHFAKFIAQFTFATPRVPVLANVDAKPYHPAIIQENLTQQITHSVQWTAIVNYLLTKKNIQIEEVGPGNVLSKLIQQIRLA